MLASPPNLTACGRGRANAATGFFVTSRSFTPSLQCPASKFSPRYASEPLLRRQGQTTRIYGEDIGFCWSALTDPRR
jgi:hypothetical protein